jgi:hypothetical protein
MAKPSGSVWTLKAKLESNEAISERDEAAIALFTSRAIDARAGVRDRSNRLYCLVGSKATQASIRPELRG